MKNRVISAVVMLSISAVCVYISPITRILLFAVIGGLCAYEFSINVEKLEARCTLWVMLVYILVQAVLCFLHLQLLYLVAWFVFCVYLALFSGVIHPKVGGKGALFTLAGLLYPCLLVGVIMVICLSDIWVKTLVSACLATWFCDSFALFGGMRFGKHKIAPLVSPNKTVEGCVCGAISSVFTGFIIYYIFKIFSPMPLSVCVLTALVSSTMGQIGDLAESLLKRMIGVKDFSNLIPGHGGMFDRADSLMFAIPTTYFCFLIAGVTA